MIRYTQGSVPASTEIARFFKIFADEGRIKILRALLEGSKCVTHICEAVDMEQSAVSHNLAILRRANLVKASRSDRKMVYSIADEHIRLILDMAIIHISDCDDEGKEFLH